jgi:hypothetical protein
MSIACAVSTSPLSTRLVHLALYDLPQVLVQSVYGYLDLCDHLSLSFSAKPMRCISLLPLSSPVNVAATFGALDDSLPERLVRWRPRSLGITFQSTMFGRSLTQLCATQTLETLKLATADARTASTLARSNILFNQYRLCVAATTHCRRRFHVI